MSKLQQLLDERWPLTEDISWAKSAQWEFYRDIFSQGYNSRIAEEKEQSESEDTLYRNMRAKSMANINKPKS